MEIRIRHCLINNTTKEKIYTSNPLPPLSYGGGDREEKKMKTELRPAKSKIKNCEMCGERITSENESMVLHLCDFCFDEARQDHSHEYEQHSDADPGL